MKIADRFAARLAWYMAAERRDASDIPLSTVDAMSKAWRLPEIAWDFPNAYKLVPEIFFCIGVRQDTVASTPLRFFTQGREGKKTFIEPQPGNVAGLWYSPNSQETGRDLVAGIQGSRDLFGDAFLFLERTNKIVGLWLLNPLSVERLRGEGRSIIGYRVKDGGKTRQVAPEDIIEFPRFDPSFGLGPVSPMQPLEQQYTAIYDASRVARNFFKNSGIPPGFFSSDQAFDEPARIRLARAISKMVKALSKRWGSVILPKNLKYERAASSFEEMQFTDIDKLLAGKIYSTFRIPPFYTGATGGTGLNSDVARASRRLLHEMVREPECQAIAAVLNTRLLAPGGLGLQVRCEFDFSGVPAVQEDKLDEAIKLVTLTGAPILTRNEARERLGIEPNSDPAADELLVPLNLLTSDDRDVAAGSAQGVPAPNSADANATARLLARTTSHRDRRDRLRVRADRRLRRHERSMERGFRRVFRRQELRVKQRLRDQLEGRMNGQAMAALRAIDVNDLLQEDDGDVRIIRRIVRAIVEEQGAQALADLGLELAFSVAGGEVASWIDEHAARAITDTSATTRKHLREELSQGVEANETLDQLVARVSDVFAGRRANVLTIARTETAPAFNFATESAWEQSEVVESKEWLTAHDEQVRDAHVEADGQRRNLGEPFDVDAEQLDFPGDPSGSPGNVINCRCTLLPVVRSRAALPSAIAERLRGATLKELLGA
ncbi:MAG: hypothetical protein RI885_2273 [Actinomycetota bacterium]